MIGIVVDDDRIGIPQPVVHIPVLERSDAEISTVEPEALAIAALQMENVAGSETEGESAMLVWTVQMKAPIVRREILVTHPLAVRMDVRSVGVPVAIAKITLLAVTPLLRSVAVTLRSLAPSVRGLFRSLRGGALGLWRWARRRRPVRRI